MGPQVAVYWDLEDLGRSERGPRHPAGGTVDVDAVFRYAGSHGRVVLSRAYADWRFLAERGQVLHDRSTDLVQVFRAEGVADTTHARLMADAAEDLAERPFLTHVLVVAGERDFTAIARVVRRRGRMFVGVGGDRVDQRYLAACDTFVRHADLDHPARRPAAAVRAAADRAEEIRRELRGRSVRLPRDPATFWAAPDAVVAVGATAPGGVVAGFGELAQLLLAALRREVPATTAGDATRVRSLLQRCGIVVLLGPGAGLGIPQADPDRVRRALLEGLLAHLSSLRSDDVPVLLALLGGPDPSGRTDRRGLLRDALAAEALRRSARPPGD